MANATGKVIRLLADNNPDDVWFQQDGATSHSSQRSLGILRDMFPGHLVSLRGDIGWPPCSPDLTPCDFFLWGHIKSQVYRHRLANLEELKAAITHEINAIPQDMVERAMVNFRVRLQNCIDIGGRHFQNIQSFFLVSSCVCFLLTFEIGSVFLTHPVL